MNTFFNRRCFFVIGFMCMVSGGLATDEAEILKMGPALGGGDISLRKAAIQWVSDHKLELIDNFEVAKLLDAIPKGQELPGEVVRLVGEYLKYLHSKPKQLDPGEVRIKETLLKLHGHPGALLYDVLEKGVEGVPQFEPDTLSGWERMANGDHGLYGDYLVCLASNAKGPELERYQTSIKQGNRLLQRNLIWASQWASNPELWQKIADLSQVQGSETLADDYCEALARIMNQLTDAPGGTPNEERKRLRKLVAVQLEHLLPNVKDDWAKQEGEMALLAGKK